MADPFTLTAVGAVVLTEGIKFLYGQAGDALKRWRERKAAGKSAGVEPVDVQLPSEAFAGQLERPQLHFDAVERLEQELRDLRTAVADYADGIDPVNPKNEELLQTTDALRQAMEAVYGQRITFAGEPRPPSGPLVAGEANVDQVHGYVAGLRARKIVGGTAKGVIRSTFVARGAEAVGLEVGTIGAEAQSSPPPDSAEGTDQEGAHPSGT
jgi:hypothetical protein